MKSTEDTEKKKHKTVPIADSKSYISGYPRKLTLYKSNASPYFWVRYYADGKIIKRSTKTESKREAITFAKAFYDEINLRRSQGYSLVQTSSFRSIATAMLKSMKAQVARDELTHQTYQISEYRLKKTLLPYFGNRDIGDIHYEDLDKFLTTLSHQTPKLTASTISSYMKLVRKVFNYGYKRRDILNLPDFPTVKGDHTARGYFTLSEYRQLWSRARALVGKQFEYRKLKEQNGEEQIGQYFAEGTCKEGRLIRKVRITRELSELIVFMVNSFIRPTDIKNIQHKHVEIIDDEYNYLRLTIPTSKRHNTPIATMQMAVEVYRRLTKHNEEQGWDIGRNAHLFFPNTESRDYALKLLQMQFDVLLTQLELGEGVNGDRRTIYSLRHTCIMYRLLYGENIDVITLARNARTSQEMIDRFYASQLKGEDNIGMIQSRRKRRIFD
ncbi:hypothetical protein OAT45_02225 [Alphaproteobacteria bacterium]|nr:hypothetical protein [Alphaproteobacteria bacterium]